jgi:uncharacterized protein YndB with AHSA1/START domain
MERETTIERSLYINASPEVIWRVLTEPELTKLYREGWHVRSDWKRGGPVQWFDKLEGVEQLKAQGTLMAYLPGDRLRYTWLDLRHELPDEPASYTTVDISLHAERDGRTHLHLWHGDFAGLPHDVRRAREVGRQWVEALVGLKRVAEEQQGQMAA